MKNFTTEIQDLIIEHGADTDIYCQFGDDRELVDYSLAPNSRCYECITLGELLQMIQKRKSYY